MNDLEDENKYRSVIPFFLHWKQFIYHTRVQLHQLTLISHSSMFPPADKVYEQEVVYIPPRVRSETRRPPGIVLKPFQKLLRKGSACVCLEGGILSRFLIFSCNKCFSVGAPSNPLCFDQTSELPLD